MTPFQELISHISAGSEVKVGEWTITNANPLSIGETRDPQTHRFVATVSNQHHHGGQSFESALAITPSTQENLAGLHVDLTVEIHAKMQSTFTDLPFSTPLGTARTPQMPATRTQDALSL